MIQSHGTSVGTVHLAGRLGDEPIAVDLLSFFEFSYSLAEELEDLVAKYRATSHVVLHPGPTMLPRWALETDALSE